MVHAGSFEPAQTLRQRCVHLTIGRKLMLLTKEEVEVEVEEEAAVMRVATSA